MHRDAYTNIEMQAARFGEIMAKTAHEQNGAIDNTKLRTLVIGAGDGGLLTIGRMLNNSPKMPGEPVAIIDDDPKKLGKKLHGITISGTCDDIEKIVAENDIEQIVIAIPSATKSQYNAIFEKCSTTDCVIKTLPSINNININNLSAVSFHDIDMRDLLGRQEIVLDMEVAKSYIKDKVVLVTGGGGSIGSELCRQIAPVNPKRIVIFDIYENDAYLLKQEMKAKYPDLDLVIEVGSVCNRRRLKDVFSKHAPSVVFHAAAHKHVPLMEICPREAIENNVFGTLNAVQAAIEGNVDHFIFISTDKAVNPTSIMGATKRIGEMIIQYHDTISDTIFAAVRFGNVLGSHGSVIPIFEEQIANGGPVTVTDPEIERYFMTIPEATRLVIQAGGIAKGGEVFVLDMGEPVKILTLAKNLIRASGFKPDEIEIVFTGLRDGEKMYEELFLDEEDLIATNNPSIMVSGGSDIGLDEITTKLRALENSLSLSEDEAREAVHKAVPNFIINS